MWQFAHPKVVDDEQRYGRPIGACVDELIEQDVSLAVENFVALLNRAMTNGSLVDKTDALGGWVCQIENRDFGPAVHADSTQVSDPACNIHLTSLPCFKTGNEPLIFYGHKALPHHRHKHLPAVGVAAEHQIPWCGGENVFRVRIVRKKDHR
jgi:hypothetical protein